MNGTQIDPPDVETDDELENEEEDELDSELREKLKKIQREDPNIYPVF